MSDELNGFLNEQSQEAPQVEERQVQEAPEQENQEPEAHGEPTSPSTDKHVPLAALEAERSQRKDWKEKAIRAEAERDALRAQYEQARQQPSQHQEQMQPVDPVTAMGYMVSERFAREKHGDEFVNAAYKKVEAASLANPALAESILRSRDPWDAIVKEAKRMELVEKIGGDPDNFEKAMREKILAEMAETNQSAAPAAPRIPVSMANARSAAGRTATAFTGPPGLDDILNMK